MNVLDGLEAYEEKREFMPGHQPAESMYIVPESTLRQHIERLLPITKEVQAESSTENDPEIAAGNQVNEVLRAHKAKWNGDDEIQDMLAEAFVRGMKFHADGNGLYEL